MPETLLSPSNLLIYGRAILDLQVVPAGGVAAGQSEPPSDPPACVPENHNPFVEERRGDNFFLQRQLNAEGARLARIYGFSFEGHYYDLSRPCLFLVHGDGHEAETLPAAPRVARGPDGADLTGVAAQDYSFSEDIRVWAYDKDDMSIKLDMETGSFTDLLLEAGLNEDSLQSYHSGARASGARASGARASGARASGARVSGARVSGARVGGNGD